MWADVLTKPLQGQKFRDMGAFLQNCPRDYKDDTEFKLSVKPQDIASSRECVGEQAKQKKTRNQANHNSINKPQAPHVYHESHGGQIKPHGSQVDPTKGIPLGIPQRIPRPRDPTKNPMSKGSHKEAQRISSGSAWGQFDRI
jgi:hypothetical protein